MAVGAIRDTPPPPPPRTPQSSYPNLGPGGDAQAGLVKGLSNARASVRCPSRRSLLWCRSPYSPSTWCVVSVPGLGASRPGLQEDLLCSLHWYSSHYCHCNWCPCVTETEGLSGPGGGTLPRPLYSSQKVFTASSLMGSKQR